MNEHDALKNALLARLGRDIDFGINQIENNQFTEYAWDEFPGLAEKIKAEGRLRQAAKRGR